MPRKQRIEYPGAMYHVISRGNYRKDLFSEKKTGEAFEKTIFEAAERCGWKLYAYVVMSNHYHLALETPEPNLVEGMKWLQSAFATRFNRFHGERGHVFQGRYKSLVLEEDRPLLGLIDYIHLNPVRAGLCSVNRLGDYTLSRFSEILETAGSASPRPRDGIAALRFAEHSFGDAQIPRAVGIRRGRRCGDARGAFQAVLPGLVFGK